MKTPEWFRPFARRIRLMTARAVVRLIDDATAMQLLQVDLLAGETRDRVERFQQYGFTAHPRPGAEAITLSVGGHRSHTVVIAVDDRRYRLTGLAEGEVAIYDDQGQAVHIKRDRIDLRTPTLVVIDAPQAQMTGDLIVDGNTSIGGRLSVAQDASVTDALQVGGAATVGGLSSTGAAGSASISGDMQVTGNITASGDVDAAGISLVHHIHTGDSGGNTSPPQ